MRATIAAGALVLLGAISLHAEPSYVAEGGTPDDFASARLAYFGKERGIGQLAFTYGRPAWRPEYDDTGKFDALTKGKVWRFGSNFWTTLYTDLPITIGGKAVAPGAYFLGLVRSADGASWSLAFFDSAKVRAARIDASDIELAHVEFTAPMTTEPRREEAAQKLTVTLAPKDKAAKEAKLDVSFGHLSLTSLVTVKLPQ